MVDEINCLVQERQKQFSLLGSSQGNLKFAVDLLALEEGALQFANVDLVQGDPPQCWT